MSESNELVLFPSLKAQRLPNGKLVMTQKYMEGAGRFVDKWPGPVTVMVELDDRPTEDMDRVEARPELFGFEIEERPKSEDEFANRLKHSAIGLGFLAGNNIMIAKACNKVGMPLVCTSEYSPRTERQIVAAELPQDHMRRARRLLWLHAEEKRRQKLLPMLAGLQCSGTPTYDLYRHLVPSALLFFDNRVYEKDILPTDQVKSRFNDLLSGRPLKLVFGGRLSTMKGVSELPKIARELRDRRIPFEMTIVGTGPLESALKDAASFFGLNNFVKLLPPMDFRNGWIPFLRDNADLFVCPHVQGDPSSTYSEVMSCGVPIVGYANEAFEGVLKNSGGGWASPLRRPAKLAELIGALDKNREEILKKAQAAVSFASEHAFEKTFERRAEHLRSLGRFRSS
ncbi:glycosyltransferase family 4 protein [Ruegeria arenilitoris]|uniref:glycosyltransferase family 4 protein n=2 Tax=Ruegeria arenilitoris TaxID=1173585 RepID=UPI001C2CC1B7|nr:glycosyltransferase family 4 protein [Ruegeria arenilitoris]